MLATKSSRPVIFSDEGASLKGTKETFLLILKRGEEVIDAITRCAEQAQLKGATLSAIGAVTHVDLGYYCLPDKNYQHKVFEDEYELVSLIGNVALKDDKPFTHAHISMGDDKYALYGGHLFSAAVAATVEIAITPLSEMPVRTMDDEVGLALITGSNP